MYKSVQTKRWFITQNNPSEYGVTHDVIENILTLLSSVYYCISDEIGTSGTYHTHIYAVFPSSISFAEIKRLFPASHVDHPKGNSWEIRDYVFKEGKSNDNQKGTNFKHTHIEKGTMPDEYQEIAGDLYELSDYVKLWGIFDVALGLRRKYLRLSCALDDSSFRRKQNMPCGAFETTFIEGRTEIDKTDLIIRKHGQENVFIVPDCLLPLESYNHQSVIVFNLNHPFTVTRICPYIDRYNMTVFSGDAEKIYIVSDVGLYLLALRNSDFWARIHKVIRYNSDGRYREYEKETYLSDIYSPAMEKSRAMLNMFLKC